MALASPTTPGEEIDPSHTFSGTERFLVKQLFTGLTELGPDGRARNRLATRIVPDPTCRQWKIEIRNGTTFSDGTPVDARAFARGWNRSAAVETGGASYLMNDIEGFSKVAGGSAEEMSGVRAVSGTLLTVSLTSPNCDFAARLSEPAFMPVPETAGDPGNESFNTRPVGNGPFTLEEHREGSRIALARNSTWAFGKTKFDRVEIRLGHDPAVGRAAYAAGDVDWTALTPGGQSTAPQGMVTRPSPFTRMLVPITARGPMKSREARQAVSYAIGRSKIVQALDGLGAPAQGIVPPAVPGFVGGGRCPSCDAQDAEKAKQLAAQAGLKPGTEINLYFREMSSYPEMAEVVRNELQTALGLRVALKPTSIGADQFDDFRKAVVSDDASGLVLFAWGPDYVSPYPMLWPILGGDLVATSDNSYFNLSGWKSARFDELMSTALRNPQAGTRTSLFKEAEKLALDDLAVIPLANDAHAAITKKSEYTGLELDYDGHPTVATAALK
ncbi:ABC transporter substrate-binding protein [Actinomadura sp. KC345]|nr:ABC transporter substrate-binding protein [Actinomadura sp. KC345]